jgi:hypothetical protein
MFRSVRKKPPVTWFPRALERVRLRTLTALPLVVAMLTLGSIVILGQPATTMAPAGAAPARLVAATHGTGMMLRGQWFGSWRTSDGRGFCIEFDKGHPNTRGVRKNSGRLPGLSSEESARVRYVTNAYGSTSSKVDAAAAAIYVWTVQDTSRFNRYYAQMRKSKAIPSRVLRRVGQIAAEAKNHGPYKLTMSMGAGYVGQTVNGTVTVRAQNGRPVSGMRITLTASNASVTKAARATDSRGRLAYSARVTKLGAVRVSSRLSTRSTNVWITTPSAGHQRLALAGRGSDTASATVASQRRIGRPTVTSACSGDCQGRAPVTVSMTNPRGSATLRQYIFSNNVRVGYLDIPAGTTRRTTLQLPDEAKVTTSYCYLTSARQCSSAPVANAGAFVVECPPAAEFRYTGNCPCDAVKTITYEVRAPAGSRRRYTATLTTVPAAGQPVTTTVALTAGSWTKLPQVKVPTGTRVDLSFKVLNKSVLLDRSTQGL